MRILTLAAALAVIATGAVAQDTVRIGTEGAYPPYNYINDAGELEGFEIELGNELCRRVGVTCEWVVSEWDAIIANLVSGNYDAILASLTIIPEREEIIDFTQNYLQPAPSAYMALSEEADIQGGHVAVQAATIQAAYVAESGATPLEFATPEETVAAVRDGEAEAVLADRDYLAPFVEASGGELMFVGEEVTLGSGVGTGLRESDTELKERFDAAISEMKEDGSLNGLIVKWFGEEAATF